jgi:hypothetical protein
MLNWKTASRSDYRKLAAIRMILKKHPERVEEIFQATAPSLRISPQALMRLCTGCERILIGLSYDIWCGLVGISISELEKLDDETFKDVITALLSLRS